MKTQLSEDGTLSIISESTVESFALKHWFDLWSKHQAVLRVETKAIINDDSQSDGKINL